MPGNVEALGCVWFGSELPQAKHNGIQTVELTNSSRRRVGMSAQLSHPGPTRATGCRSARAKRTGLGRVLRLSCSPKPRQAQRAEMRAGRREKSAHLSAAHPESSRARAPVPARAPCASARNVLRPASGEESSELARRWAAVTASSETLPLRGLQVVAKPLGCHTSKVW